MQDKSANCACHPISGEEATDKQYSQLYSAGWQPFSKSKNAHKSFPCNNAFLAQTTLFLGYGQKSLRCLLKTVTNHNIATKWHLLGHNFFVLVQTSLAQLIPPWCIKMGLCCSRQSCTMFVHIKSFPRPDLAPLEQFQHIMQPWNNSNTSQVFLAQFQHIILPQNKSGTSTSTSTITLIMTCLQNSLHAFYCVLWIGNNITKIKILLLSPVI